MLIQDDHTNDAKKPKVVYFETPGDHSDVQVEKNPDGSLTLTRVESSRPPTQIIDTAEKQLEVLQKNLNNSTNEPLPPVHQGPATPKPVNTSQTETVNATEKKEITDIYGLMDEVCHPNLTPQRKTEIEILLLKLIRDPQNTNDVSLISITPTTDGHLKINVKLRTRELKMDEEKKPFYLITEKTNTNFVLEKAIVNGQKGLKIYPLETGKETKQGINVELKDENSLAKGLKIAAITFNTF